MELAQLHVQFMRETNQGLDNVEKTAEMVLAPASTRLKEQIQRARQRADKNPADAANAAHELLEQARRSLALFDLFHGEGEHWQKDVFDDVANVVVTCAIAHQRKTSDNEIFVALLEQALPLAMSTDVRQRIQKNVGIGKGNLKYKLLEPVYGALRAIEESDANPKTKLAKIRQEITPHLAGLVRTEGGDSSLVGELPDSLALALRGISIDAHNDHDDIATALDAILSACELAREPGLKKRLADDKAQILRNKQEQERHNLSLRIRSDEIEITRDKVRYNGKTLWAKDIDASRFGIFIQITNGIRSAYYTVGVLAEGVGKIDFDCKRVFRSEEQAQSDFNAVVNALYRQIAPGLCVRIAKGVLSAVDYPLGNCKLSATGHQTLTDRLRLNHGRRLQNPPSSVA